MLPKASEVLKELLENLNIVSVDSRTEQVMVALLDKYFNEIEEDSWDKGYARGHGDVY